MTTQQLIAQAAALVAANSRRNPMGTFSGLSPTLTVINAPGDVPGATLNQHTRNRNT